MIHRFTDCVLDGERRELRRAGKLVAVEPQVFDLLALFASRPDSVVSRSDLIDAVWGGRVVSDATIDSRIAAARRAIGDSGSTQALIRTVPRRGFRFTATVTTDQAGDPYPQPPLPDLPSIAVLPFENRSLDPRLGFAADALVEDVTALLARQGGFFVVSARSAAIYRDRSVDLRVVGRELGVRYVVTGSVRESGSDIGVVVNLVDAQTGAQRWTGFLNAPFDDLLDLQRDLARSVISEIEPALNSSELEIIRRRNDCDADAWALYRSAGGKIAFEGWSSQTFEEARALLKQAIRRDPEFALGHAYLTLLTALAEIFGFVSRSPALRAEIVDLADTAVRLDPNDSQVLSFAGCAFADIGDSKKAGELIARAIELDPSNAHAWMVRGTCFAAAGRIDEGLVDFRRGFRLSPRDRRLGIWGAVLAGCLLRAGRPDAALQEARIAYMRDGNIYIAKLIEAVAAHRLGLKAAARVAMNAIGELRSELNRPELQSFVGNENVDCLGDLWRAGVSRR
jgi:DNA-binding winged helix-turn-helix (wHTH) protein/tetratricopeptide (TPR) repeat protein